MFEPDPVGLENFLKIFTFDKKRELEKYCRQVEINQKDFAAFIIACKAGIPQIENHIRYQESSPEFVERWGEFCESVGVLSLSYDFELKSQQAEALGKAATTVDPYRQWFALWMMHYERQGVPLNFARHKLAKLLADVREGKRNVPDSFPLEIPDIMLSGREARFKVTYHGRHQS